MVDSKDRYSTKKVNLAQSAILYNCEAEALSKSIHPCQSTSSKLDTPQEARRNRPRS
ncbi:hypothetical protein YC2023_011498 [Brassica napus]